MKQLKKIIYLISFISIIFSINAFAEYCIPFSQTTPATYGGQMTLDCNICTNYFSFEGSASCDVNYQNASYYPDSYTNGSINLDVTFDSNGYKFNFNGGPLIYNINGEDYTVYFYSAYFKLSTYGDVEDAGGTITINGIEFPVNSYLFDFLF